MTSTQAENLMEDISGNELEDEVPKIVFGGAHVDPDMGNDDNLTLTERNLFFDDGKRKIDCILAYKVLSDPDVHEKQEKFRKWRHNFLEELVKEGLEIELDERAIDTISYIKVHAPWDVLTRYAELLKIQLPLQEELTQSRNKTDSKLKHGQPELHLHMEDIWTNVAGKVSVFQKPFLPCQDDFPTKKRKLMATYSRDKEYLFDLKDQEQIFSSSVRSRIVYFILRRKRFDDSGEIENYSYGITRLLGDGAFLACYPLHEGGFSPHDAPNDRKRLYNHWARWGAAFKLQPLDYVRDYYGERIALYFAWLQFYTLMLVPVSLVGLAIFIYGISLWNKDPISRDICNKSLGIVMCPLCDKLCDFWYLSSACKMAKIARVVDNGATVFYAIIMSLWATLFLEFWKRKQFEYKFRWHQAHMLEEEESPRPEYLNKLANVRFERVNKVTGVKEKYFPFWRKRVPVFLFSGSFVVFMILLAILTVVGVILYRLSLRVTIATIGNDVISKNSSLIVACTAASINLCIIFALNFIYRSMAEKLTEMECFRTQTEHDASLNLKIYLLQFVNYYSSIFYIAFFKGKFPGRPGQYTRIFGFRQEECDVGGCLTELTIQLAIIMIGKNLIKGTLQEIILVKIWKWLTSRMAAIKDKVGEEKQTKSEKKNMTSWEKDFRLAPLGTTGFVFDEYLEMVIQYGFITIFVTSFPLAPLFALLNNVMEIRVDSSKLLCDMRRPFSVPARNIGIWYDVLETLTSLSVLTNGCIIAFTTDFIPRWVYRNSHNMTLEGYLENSLSAFNTSDFTNRTRPDDMSLNGSVPSVCMYRDFRNPPGHPHQYELSTTYWHVYAAKFIFVVLFQNVVMWTKNVIAWSIPDMPKFLRRLMQRENYITNEVIMHHELERARKVGESGRIFENLMRRSKLTPIKDEDETTEDGAASDDAAQGEGGAAASLVGARSFDASCRQEGEEEEDPSLRKRKEN